MQYGQLGLAANAFVEKASRINQTLSERLRIVGIFRDDIEFAYRRWVG